MSFLHLLSASRQKKLAVTKHSFFHPKLNSALLFALLSGGFGWLALPSLATPVAGTTIENQATGTYVDTLSNDSVDAESNIVKITVGEVAGITVTPGSISGTVSAGNTVYYSYIITNVGNDATQFYIPENARVTGNGVQNGDVQIIGYDLNGATSVVLAAANYVNIGAGVATGDANVLAANGIIQPGGSVTIRVPVKVNTTAAVNDFITVLFGDTPEIASSTTTPKGRLQNQAYIDEAADQKYDVYTVDNINGTIGEFDNLPLNGDSVNRRQEASAAQRATVIGVDYGDAPDTGTGVGPGNYQTTLSDGGPSHVITPGLLIGTKIDSDSGILQNVTADADNASGTPNDEDGLVSLPALKTAAGETYTVPVKVTNTTGQPAYLVGYIDFNQNGDFSDTEDKSVTITVPSGATVGTYNVTFTTPTGMTPGNTYLRLRLGAVQAEVESSVGAAASGEVEDHALEIISPATITGTVFEDPNYGGGAGRAFISTVATPPRRNARVELYDSTGVFKGFAITDINGLYKFDTANITGGIVAGNYKVRVVNSTVTSSRPNPTNTTGLVAVQTFRTDAGITAGTVTEVIDHVGGEKPAEVDALANTTATLATLNAVTNQEVQSLTTVKVGSSDITGIDFGYNFDTIVNTNDSGQGSLRQFITNSNALNNTNLAQEGQTAGQEVSIFMISDGSARAGLSGSYSTGINGTGGNNNTAVIALSSQLIISDSNTSIDGRTQTQNVFDSNSGSVGTGGTVGTDNLALSVIPKPEIVLDFSTMPTVNGNSNPSGGGSNAIVVQGQNTTLTGFSFYGYRIQAGLGGMNKGAIWINPSVTDSGKATLTQLLGGTLADGSSPATNAYVGYAFQATGAANIFNNYFAYLADAGTFGNSTGALNTKVINFYNNEVFANGPKNTGTDASGVYADQLETEDNAKNIKIYQNLIHGATSVASSLSQGKGLQISTGSSVEVTNNKFEGNYQAGIMSAGIDSKIEKNIITDSRVDGAGNYGSGIVILKYNSNSGLRNKISQNSMYGNVMLGIDLGTYNGSTFQAGVTGNDGAINTNDTGTQAANIGMDYPIITSSTLSAGTLTVKGYVGNSSTGNAVFANKVVELFVAADDGNNNGEIILADARSKPHGEGKTYIGTCTTDGNGLFGVTPACSFTNAATLSLTNAKNITATATDSTGNTSEFSSIPNSPAQLLLVKRVTQIKDGATGTVVNYTTFVNDPTSIDENNCNWLTASGTTGACTNTYTVGAIAPNKVKSGDEVEYTIYYLNSGDNKATQARVCDRLDANLTFQTQFDSTNAATVGKGLVLVAGNTASQYLTNATDPGTDTGQLTTPALATSCNLVANAGTNLSNNVVVVDVASSANPLMGAAKAGVPTTSYGYIRFKVKVN